MYGSCIFCSAKLGANEAIERFPVGRSVAFDAARGRLWAVCPKCARWNLAPIEERWEAMEDAERLFRDTRLRVQSENVGLAKLRDGTRLIRVGEALPGELAAWRYGREMRRRFLRGRVQGTLVGLGSVAPLLGSLLGPAATLLGAAAVHEEIQKFRRADRLAHLVPAADSPTGRPLPLRWRDVAAVRTARGPGDALTLEVWRWRGMPAEAPPVVLTGPAAGALLGKAMVRINRSGADDARVQGALDAVVRAGGPGMLLGRAAVAGYGLAAPDVKLEAPLLAFMWALGFLGMKPRVEIVPPLPRVTPLSVNPSLSLAVEMALHDEQERRALQGELAALEAAWRQAEEIAAIADALPDDVPPFEPPRLEGIGNRE
ncbi:MAG TPA: hypothetical protein VFR37_03870 [Longimicrobium sp.]|nr:hypothetical protein [Longimicrobium sp.]